MQSRLFLQGPQLEHQHLHERAVDQGERRRPTKQASRAVKSMFSKKGARSGTSGGRPPRRRWCRWSRRSESKADSRSTATVHISGSAIVAIRLVCIAHATMACDRGGDAPIEKAVPGPKGHGQPMASSSNSNSTTSSSSSSSSGHQSTPLAQSRRH